MKIQFSRTGGFAGIKLQWELDLDKSPRPVARAVQRLVKESKFFELPAECRQPRPDQFQYLVAVEHDGRRHQVRADESALPENLRPLVERLLELAQQQSDSTA